MTQKLLILLDPKVQCINEFTCKVTEVLMKEPDMPLPKALSDDLSLENVHSCKYASHFLPKIPNDRYKSPNHAQVDLYTPFFASDFLS